MQDRLLLDDFKSYVEKEKLFQPEDVLLLAVSGGIDSAVLCELCHLSGYPFVIAHCNFNLRGKESEEDEIFVRQLAARYEVPILVKRFNAVEFAGQRKISIQVAARELRYAWFNDIVNGNDLPGYPDNSAIPRYIVTAHHADDNIETVLMNFFKGTGITGMRGMLPKTGKLLRPLLFAQKTRMHSFASAQQISYREDSSNLSDKYSRNYIRHQVLPLIEKIYPGAAENITANIERFRETACLYHEAIDIHRKKLLQYRNNDVYIPVLKLLKIIPLNTVLYEITKQYGFTSGQTNETVKLLHSDSGKFILSSSHRILKNRNWLIISPIEEAAQQIRVIEPGTDVICFENGCLRLRKKKLSPSFTKASADSSLAMLDIKHIHFPLLLRKWQPGDYFYPFGMPRKKKLSRFFIDQKLSLADKERVWVLEMDKKIIWVINHRIDDRFKVTDNTKEILKIQFRPA